MGIGRHWDAGVVGELLQYLGFLLWFLGTGSAPLASCPLPKIPRLIFPQAVWAADKER